MESPFTSAPVSTPSATPTPSTPLKSSQLTPVQIALFSAGGLLVTFIALFGINKAIDSKLNHPSSTPTPTAVAMLSPTPTATDLPTPTEIPTPTLKPTPTPKPTPKPTPTPTPTPATTPSPTPTTSVTVTTVAGQDGYVTSTGTVSSDKDIRVGRNSSETIRGFVGFDIAAIPKTATITSATLRLYQRTVNGNPFSSGQGDLTVDHLDYGSSLSSGSYGATATLNNVGVLSSNNSSEWKQVMVTDRVKADLSSHTSSQFRLRFTSESVGGDSTGDVVYFDSASSGYNTNQPQLVITYY